MYITDRQDFGIGKKFIKNIDTKITDFFDMLLYLIRLIKVRVLSSVDTMSLRIYLVVIFITYNK
jgi:hypothetical protein